MSSICGVGDAIQASVHARRMFYQASDLHPQLKIWFYLETMKISSCLTESNNISNSRHTHLKLRKCFASLWDSNMPSSHLYLLSLKLESYEFVSPVFFSHGSSPRVPKAGWAVLALSEQRPNKVKVRAASPWRIVSFISSLGLPCFSNPTSWLSLGFSPQRVWETGSVTVDLP